MSRHSYSRCWLHLIWATLDREPMLTKPAAARASQFLTRYASEKTIYMKINYCNPEHVHALIDMPTNKSIEERNGSLLERLLDEEIVVCREDLQSGAPSRV